MTRGVVVGIIVMGGLIYGLMILARGRGGVGGCMNIMW